MKLTERFSEALVYGADLHAGQERKFSGAPYISHLLRTAGIALEHGADEDEAIAAFLHDAVEDQGGEPTLRDVARRFGDRVAAIVEGCTDAYQQPKPPWRPRKEAFLRRLESASASVRLVTACDKLDNARAILADYIERGDAIWDGFRGGRDGVLWYYRSVVEILKRGGPSPLVAELDRVVGQIHAAVGDSHPGGVARNSS